MRARVHLVGKKLEKKRTSRDCNFIGNMSMLVQPPQPPQLVPVQAPQPPQHVLVYAPML